MREYSRLLNEIIQERGNVAWQPATGNDTSHVLWENSLAVWTFFKKFFEVTLLPGNPQLGNMYLIYVIVILFTDNIWFLSGMYMLYTVLYMLYTGYIQVIYMLYTGYIPVIVQVIIHVIHRLYTGYIHVMYRLYTGYNTLKWKKNKIKRV